MSIELARAIMHIRKKRDHNEHAFKYYLSSLKYAKPSAAGG